jgi:hypothetical protein
VLQRALDVALPAGGPRAEALPPRAFGPSLPLAELRATPEHLPALPAQSRVAEAADHADAPATDAAPPLADEPGAVGAAGVVAGWF